MSLLSFLPSSVIILFNQLRLSVTSIDFYKDVYKNYEGYGIKYLFNISFITTVIYCAFILNYMTILDDYLKGAPVSKVTENLEYIINQIPEIKYEDGKISIQDGATFYLYNKNKSKIGIIDLNNEIPQGEKASIPIILTTDRIIINISGVAIKKQLATKIEYYKLFPSEGAKVITTDMVKKILAYELDKLIDIFIYIGVPLLIAVWFVTFLLEKSVIIILVYAVTSIFGPKTLLKTCIRLVMFASGLSVLLQPIVTLLFPAFSEVILLIQLYTTGLLLTMFWQMRNRRILF